MPHRLIALFVLCVVALAALTVAVAQVETQEQPTTRPVLDRTAYDLYLWELAHHPDTLAALEGLLNDGEHVNPWAWRVWRSNSAYNSKTSFDASFFGRLQWEYGNKARAELVRRQAIAKKLDHTLWELFQSIVVYNREVLLSPEQNIELLAIEEAKHRRERSDRLVKRLKQPPHSVEKWGTLPPARSKPADSKKP